MHGYRYFFKKMTPKLFGVGKLIFFILVMDVRKVLETKSYDEIVEILASLSASSDPSSIKQLKDFLMVRDRHTFTKFTTPRIVCLALLQKGLAGIRTLVDAISDAPGVDYPRSIIDALWYAAEGRVSRHYNIEGVVLISPLNSALPQKTIEYANEALDELIIQSLENEKIFETVIGFLDSQRFLNYRDSSEEKRRFRSRVFDTFVKGRMPIKGSIQFVRFACRNVVNVSCRAKVSDAAL